MVGRCITLRIPDGFWFGYTEVLLPLSIQWDGTQPESVQRADRLLELGHRFRGDVA
ncbi:hypothetical protein GCM10025857_15330 [Alicyclobacillus contaminans]|uniref:hypothetical protein n=1 Tax=Alicyclobacillus contaminans TaxID=392016 RepID=UPI000407CE5B|nr:hypothetical protein [Alicyclobacillus contaminans]GMA50176.1 hypothetical protein GCM10025857_15330 [Alicyclobacillus contaminans]